jgi:omega-6 fatty acid desaturase (delta-12 desaturase)
MAIATGLKANEVRAVLPETAHERSLAKALALFTLGNAGYLACVAGIVCLPWWPVKLFLSLGCGFFTGILFVIGHDACHGSFTSSRWLNGLLGRLAFLPSWHPFTGWEHAHNHVHHAWTNLRGRDYAWAPLSKAEYDKKSALGKWLQRFYRTPLGFGPYYFFQVYLRRTIFPDRECLRRMRMVRFRADCLMVLAFIFAQGWLLAIASRWRGTSVWETLLFAQWIPFAVWNWLIAFLIYLHHTHPRIPWFADQKEWSFYRSQILGTAHVTFPGPINWVIHNIMEHTAHHADMRIPCYNLAEAQASMNAAFSHDIVEHKFSLRSFRYTLRTCQLYDFANHRWTNWSGQPTSSRTIDMIEPTAEIAVPL